MQLIFLGTSSMVPTKERNHTSLYLNVNGEGILFDCGEGTQRQIKIAGIKPSSIKKLFISHWHGDHVLGIPGLIETLGHNEYKETLEVYGPKGTEKNIKSMLSFFSTISKIKYNVTEMENENTVKCKEYEIKSYLLDHIVPCLGYTFTESDKLRIKKEFLKENKIPEGPHLKKLQSGKDFDWEGKKIKVSEATTKIKGKSLGFIFDTKLTDNCYQIAENKDILVSESTFSNKYKENAEKFKHLTSVQAGIIAKESNVKKLYLTHFSQRFKETKEILREAKKEFSNTVISEDFMKVNI